MGRHIIGILTPAILGYVSSSVATTNTTTQKIKSVEKINPSISREAKTYKLSNMERYEIKKLAHAVIYHCSLGKLSKVELMKLMSYPSSSSSSSEILDGFNKYNKKEGEESLLSVVLWKMEDVVGELMCCMGELFYDWQKTGGEN